ncbi:hypothetical protein JCM11491_000209 [Sporobolomyces phaffii]
MATSGPARSASVDSHDMHGESDFDQPDESQASQAGPPRRRGKGRATKETDRKAQNRIAQREFRQRKQAYIKELEGKVKLHELGRDEQVERLTDAVHVLLAENENLRQLLAGLSGFIGEGLGGVLPRLKTTLPEFQNLISQTQVDIANGALRLYELGIPSKSPGGSNAIHHAAPLPASSLPHPPTQPSHPIPSSSSTYPPLHPPASARAPASTPPNAQPFRSMSGPAAWTTAPHTLPVPVPTSQPLPPAPTRSRYDEEPYTDDPGERFGQQFENQDNPEFVEFTRWFLDQIQNGNMDAADDMLLRCTSQPSNNKVLQAMQLISYHMKSKREHPDYILPPSLKATPTQTLVPHSAVFDGIVFPSLRDRLILLKDQYPLAELTKDLFLAIRIHGNDLLLSENWELSAEFLRKYWFVIDDTVLDITNRWRKARGEPELDMKSIVPDME